MMGFDDFAVRRKLALELLNKHHEHQTHKSSQFLGQCACSRLPLSAAQEEWLFKLAEKAGLAETEQ